MYAKYAKLISIIDKDNVDTNLTESTLTEDFGWVSELFSIIFQKEHTQKVEQGKAKISHAQKTIFNM